MASSATALSRSCENFALLQRGQGTSYAADSRAGGEGRSSSPDLGQPNGYGGDLSPGGMLTLPNRFQDLKTSNSCALSYALGRAGMRLP
jgi:hypothetical protein